MWPLVRWREICTPLLFIVELPIGIRCRFAQPPQMEAVHCVETTGHHDGDDAVDLLLSEGLAWYQEDYASEYAPAVNDLYRRLRAEARTLEHGFWSELDPISPKTCRHLKKSIQSCS